MAITSSSTYDQVLAEYKDTASYFSDNDIALAKRHAIAIRFLLMDQPSSATKGANSVSFRIDLLQKELERAEKFAWAAAKTVMRVDFRRMRENG